MKRYMSLYREEREFTFFSSAAIFVTFSVFPACTAFGKERKFNFDWKQLKHSTQHTYMYSVYYVQYICEMKNLQQKMAYDHTVTLV